MTFNLSEQLPRDIHQIESYREEYIAYTVKPEPVYTPSNKNNESGKNENYDDENSSNLPDDDPLEAETPGSNIYKDRGTLGCPIWVEG